MKRVLACVLFGALLGSARAGDAPETVSPAATEATTPPTTEATTLPALTVMPQHMGYALDQPEILIRQRLFGLAHGLSMLAAACLDLPEHSAPIQEAYAAWHAAQARTIETMAQDLARYYFGPRADEAGWQDLVRALNLNDSIQPSLGSVSLQDACASLPAALARPRYEFGKLLTEAAAPAAAAPPAPTPAATPAQ
ncbi:MAG: hypothetical protein NTW45_06335 [Rhodocyclales bacterium]|nr:hypothetical protein [Rhodocyclales bacterium]